jgi:cyclophilin family peptidyl-prolyl cis-trans isomerase
MITLQTSLGDITFETYDADAPKTVENFITLAQKGFYDNVIFHRVIEGFMIQGGDPTGTGRGGPGYMFADELNPATPSYQAGYKRGVVAMANAGPNTNGSQFFIMLQDTPLPHNYTIFGKVTKGQEVVDAIGKLPVDANDRPLTPPVIQKVTVSTAK